MLFKAAGKSSSSSEFMRCKKICSALAEISLISFPLNITHT